MKTCNIKRTLPFLAIILLGLVCFIFYNGWYQYHFDYQEQNQLFLEDGQYLLGYFHQPAWLSCMLGDFLTQYYYYRFAGPAILAVCLAAFGLLTFFSLRKAGLQRGNTVITLLAMLLFADLSLRYDYKLSSLLSVIGGIALFLLFAKLSTIIRKPYLNAVLSFICTALTFWCFGNGFIAFALLLTVYFLTHGQKALLIFIATAIAICLLPLTSHLYTLDTKDLLAYPGIGKLTAPEFAMEKELGVEAEYDFGNWNKVVSMVEKESNPTQGQLFFYNLVKAQRGELPDVLMRYPNNYLGTFEQIGPATPLLTVKRMNDLYWTLGDMTFAERAAMQALVFSPNNRNVKMIRRLAEISIVEGNKNAANKYLSMLDKTAVYRKWAENVRKNDREYIEKRKFTNHKDTLRVSDNSHLIMMELLDSNPENNAALDYLLCSDLLQKDITNFKRDYDRYCMKNNEGRIRPLYQQALMIWLAGTKAPETEWERYIRMPDQLQKFQEYNQMRGSSAFAGTYWYWFDKLGVRN